MPGLVSTVTQSRPYRLLRRHFSSLLKIGVTVIGLALVLSSIPLAQIRDELVIVSWPWLFLALAMITFSLVLRAFRWGILLKGLNATVHFGRLVELYFVGNFYNAFLPSGFGGDAVRILEIARDVPPNVAAGTVLVDRLTGLLALFMMALLALPFRPEAFPDYLAALVAGVCLIGFIGGIILFEGTLVRRLGGWLPGALSPVGDGPIAKLLEAIGGCGWRAILGAFGISIIFNLLLVAWWAAAGRALGYDDIPYTYYLLVVPIMSVALLVPSIGGLGVRELLAEPLFQAAGLSGAQAVALSLLVWLLMRVVSLLGAPIYILATIRENKTRSRNAKGVNTN
ncbi:MAG: flippase-like domain-containing protein [Chloroflexota bacterium]|nr:MAG: flippase-like domain-containing protein [Chloroflexota bacterium]